VKLRKANKPHTTIANDALRDPRLSLKAKGLLALLLSLPDDWTYRLEWVVQQSKDGRDATRAALAELREAGYLKTTPARGDDGQFVGHDWLISDQPMDLEGEIDPTEPPDSRATDFQESGNPVAHTKKDKTNKDLTNLRTVHQGSYSTHDPPETEAAGEELSKHLERQRRVETRERLRDIERQVMQPVGGADRRLAELMRELTMAGLDKRRWQLWLEAQVHPHLERLGPDVFTGVLAEAIPRATGARDPRAFLAHALRGVNPPRRGATPQQALEELDLDALLGPLEEVDNA